MNRYLPIPLLLLSSSSLVAHPGHGTIPAGDVWFWLTPVALLTLVGLLGYRRYLANRNHDD
jgi:hypothetical protein